MSRSTRFYTYCGVMCLAALVAATVGIKALRAKPLIEIPPPNSVIVSKTGEGQYKTISDAVLNAKPNTRILVRPGVYKERVVIDKPLEIQGDRNGTDQEIIIENTGEACIVMQAGRAAIRGVTLRGLRGLTGAIVRFLNVNVSQEPCVEISRGQLVLEDCDITSEVVAGVGVRTRDAEAIIRRCIIHNCDANGIWFIDHATGTVEDSEIYGTSWTGIRVESGATPTFRRCKIHDIKNAGVVITEMARGVFEDCDIYANAKAGIEVRNGSSAAIRNCKIHDSGEHAVWFHRYASGTVEDSEMFGNHGVAVEIQDNSNPLIARCDIFENFESDVEINKGANPVIKDCKIHGGPGSGIYFYENGQGTIENCDIYGHEKYQEVVMTGGSKPILRNCRIHDGGAGGVLALGDAMGTFEDCSIYNNRFSGIWVRQSARPVISRCKINPNGLQAIIVHGSASPTVEDCDLTANKLGPWEVETQSEVHKSRNKE
jgi:F-box protein 11